MARVEVAITGTSVPRSTHSPSRLCIVELETVNAAPDNYATVIKACLAVPACISITS